MSNPLPRESIAVLSLALAVACGGAGASDAATLDGSAAAVEPCAVLFGKPNASTGLTGAQCRPECQSGPVFKAIAGRTRRNSGLPNAICRPCAEVRPLVHAHK